MNYLRQWAPILGVASELEALTVGRLKPKTT